MAWERLLYRQYSNGSTIYVLPLTLFKNFGEVPKHSCKADVLSTLLDKSNVYENMALLHALHKLELLII